MDIAQELEVSHSAVSQLITNLKGKGLVTTSRCAEDGRRQLVELTRNGARLLDQVLPVWKAIGQAMEGLVKEDPQSRKILEAISAVERTVAEDPLSARILRELDINAKTIPS